MKLTTFGVLWLGLLTCGSGGCASSSNSSGGATANLSRDADILRMNDQIDAARIRATIEKLVSFKTRHTLSDTTSNSEGIGAARRWIKSQFDQFAVDSGGRLLTSFQDVPAEKSERISQATTIVNVLATLPGDRDPKRVVVISGHYDSRALDVNDATSAAPGANDDGSGTALVIELARVMSKQHFNATIVFACVAGEEQGLYGAAGLAKKLHDDGDEVIAMLDNDIVGNTTGGNGEHDASHVRVFSEGVPTAETPLQLQNRQSIGGENDGVSRQLARYIDAVCDQYVNGSHVNLVFRRDRFARGGDHIPFLRRGDAAVRFTEPSEDFSKQHQNVTMKNGKPYGDLPEFVDFAYIARVARVNAAAIASLARAPAPPRGVTIDAELSYDTHLQWTANPDAAGYAVLARKTTAAGWGRRFDIGKTESVTLPLNKDDWLVAVEAYDKQGHRSLPVVPVTKRAAAASSGAAPPTAPATRVSQ